MAIDTSNFRNGLAFYLSGEVHQIIEFQHVKPGKGGAFVRTKLKRLNTGATIEKTFRAGEKIEPAYIEKKAFQFLYRQGSEFVLMDLDTYEQFYQRVWRDGQEHSVIAYHLVAEDTVDDVMLDVLDGRSRTQRDLLKALKRRYKL